MNLNSNLWENGSSETMNFKRNEILSQDEVPTLCPKIEFLIICMIIL